LLTMTKRLKRIATQIVDLNENCLRKTTPNPHQRLRIFRKSFSLAVRISLPVFTIRTT
jgi:hypothetical protein